MDIVINAKGHVNQEGLHEYYSDKLNSKYEKYPFVKKVGLGIKEIANGDIIVSLEFDMEKGANLFSKATAIDEAHAFKLAAKKIDKQIEKYKHAHYWKSN